VLKGRETGSLHLLAPLLLTGGKGADLVIRGNVVLNTDVLDPALMRSGRLDRKIEFPHPSEEARARILQVGLHNLCSIC
jgi:AAA+ superfamily predicted ATPase